MTTEWAEALKYCHNIESFSLYIIVIEERGCECYSKYLEQNKFGYFVRNQ